MPANPYSYRQYSSGSTFSVPFPYLVKAHVKVYLGYNLLTGTFTSELVDGVGFNWTSGTQIQTTSALTTGQVLTVIRLTPSETRLVDWSDGSKLTAGDLDTADLQNLYVVQEQQDIGKLGVELSTSAAAAAAAAATDASEASADAGTAAAAATTAQASATAAAASASAAVTTANSAATSASAAVTTANSAATDASAAVTTANSAATDASAAVTTANSADNKADQALDAVSDAVLYTLVANVAAIPATPANNTYIEVQDSTGIQSFTPLAGKPSGFVGDPGLRVRIVYTTAGSTWNWFAYYTSDPEARYLKLAGGTLTGALVLAGAPTVDLNPASKKYVDDGVTTLNSSISAKLDTATAASTYLTTASAASTYTSKGATIALAIALG